MRNSRFIRQSHTLLLATLLPMLMASPLGAGSILGSDRLSKFINNRVFHWQTNTSAHFTIYYETGSATVPRLNEIKASIEASRTRVLDLIQEKDFPDRIHVFLVDSKLRMKDLMGSTPYGGAIARIRVVFAVVNPTNNGCSTHEFCHVIAGATWGKPERWLDEGFATYSDERWSQRDAIAAKLATAGRWLPLTALAHDFLKHPEEVTYIQSASFVSFVINRYGMEKFKQIWHRGYRRIPQTLGRSVTELEAEWRASLSPAAAPATNSPAR